MTKKQQRGASTPEAKIASSTGAPKGPAQKSGLTLLPGMVDETALYTGETFSIVGTPTAMPGNSTAKSSPLVFPPEAVDETALYTGGTFSIIGVQPPKAKK
jgi:hypothetical protein